MLTEISRILKKFIWIKKTKLLGTIKKEFTSKFNDYRNEDEDDKENYIYEKRQLLFHQLKKQIKLSEPLWVFDAVSLYPSAMWDEKSIYPRIETGYAYTEDMNDELVEKFNNQTFHMEVLF